VMTIPGIDGRKMSKNYNNTLPLFGTPKALRKQVMRIVTDSKRPEDPKDPEQCNVFAIYSYFASVEAVAAAREKYLSGGLAYSDIKQELYELIERKFGKMRAAYEKLINDHDHLDEVLIQGAQKARAMAEPIMAKLRRKIGMRR